MADTLNLPSDETLIDLAREECQDFRWPSSALSIMRKAILAERERCAKIADSLLLKSPNNWNQVGQTQTAKLIAEKIRAGDRL